VNLGFVIDHRKCIGCHACTVACKAEHDVPLGVFRTWVKYVEKGNFPDARRYFTVLRCNHCDDAPCVTICPTVALFRRDNGIVDFDNARCIGCKSCMQACPYDALYIDPASNTAAKCNYCAHRADVGLEPACVVVCPERAIVAGDLDNPASEIHQLVAREQTMVRKPEQGTRPKVHYLGSDSASLTPQMQRKGEDYLFAYRAPGAAVPADPSELAPSARETYDVPHATPWGWKVAAYLWTKSISAGVFLASCGVFGLVGGAATGSRVGLEVVEIVLAALFWVATIGLLVGDLKRPERFWFLLVKPNLRSWLVLGGYALTAFAGAIALRFLWPFGAAPPHAFVWTGSLLALLAAGYSAFLFGQCEGRDFWQSPLLLPHLVVQALLAGKCVDAILGSLFGASPAGADVTLAILAALNGLLVAAEVFGSHANRDARAAAKWIVRGPLRAHFWRAVMLVGVLIPITFALLGLSIAPAIAALAGLLVWEWIWVQAGQAIPLS
jgi:Fe-S-cluster-containing dehydrogenase component/formate-dependent nitrite reductase membrane component NrfD